jgi:hypothetical protein
MALGQGGKGQTFDFGLAGLPPESLSELAGSMARGLVSGEEIRGRKVGDVVAEFLRGFEEARAASGKTPAFDAAAVETAFREREMIPEMPGLHRGPLEAVEELGKAFAEAAARSGSTPAFDAEAAEAAFRELLTPDTHRPGAGIFGRSPGGSGPGRSSGSGSPASPEEGLTQTPSFQPVVGTSQWPSAQPVPAQSRSSLTSWSGRPPPGVPVTPEDSYVGGYVPRPRKECLCPEHSAATDVSGSGDVLGDLHVAPEDLATDRHWKKPRSGKQVAVMPAHTLAGVGPAAASPSFAAIGLSAPDSGAASAFGHVREKPEQFPVQPPSTDAFPPPGPAFPRQPVAPSSAVPPRQVTGASPPRAELRPPQGGPVPRKPAGRSAGTARSVAPQASPPASTSPPRRRGRSSPEFQAAVAASRALDRSLEAPVGASTVRENLTAYVQAVRQVSQNTKYWERDQRLVVQEAARQKTQQENQLRRETRRFDRRYGADPGWAAKGPRAEAVRARREAGSKAEAARGEAGAARDAARDARKRSKDLSGKVSSQTASDVKKAASAVQADQKALSAAARALEATAHRPYATSEDVARAQERFDEASANLAASRQDLAMIQVVAEGEAKGRTEGPKDGREPPQGTAPDGTSGQPPDLQSAMVPAGEEDRYGPPTPAPPGAPPAVGAVTPTGTFPDCGPCTQSCEGQCHPPCKEDEVCQCDWVEGTVATVASAAPPPPPPPDGPPTVAPPYSPPGSTAGSGPDSGLGKGGGFFGGKLAPTHAVAPPDTGLKFQEAGDIAPGQGDTEHHTGPDSEDLTSQVQSAEEYVHELALLALAEWRNAKSEDVDDETAFRRVILALVKRSRSHKPSNPNASRYDQAVEELRAIGQALLQVFCPDPGIFERLTLYRRFPDIQLIRTPGTGFSSTYYHLNVIRHIVSAMNMNPWTVDVITAFPGFGRGAADDEGERNSNQAGKYTANHIGNLLVYGDPLDFLDASLHKLFTSPERTPYHLSFDEIPEQDRQNDLQRQFTFVLNPWQAQARRLLVLLRNVNAARDRLVEAEEQHDMIEKCKAYEAHKQADKLFREAFKSYSDGKQTVHDLAQKLGIRSVPDPFLIAHPEYETQ